jgi:hypothetical protein
VLRYGSLRRASFTHGYVRLEALVVGIRNVRLYRNHLLETFPFPEQKGRQREAIAEAARELDELRSAWLNPPEWTREEVREFPGSADGPWARYVHEPDSRPNRHGPLGIELVEPREQTCESVGPQMFSEVE